MAAFVERKSGAELVPEIFDLGEDDGPKITSIDLVCEAVVPGLDQAKFDELAQAAKEKCPISRLYAGTEINLTATLAG